MTSTHVSANGHAEAHDHKTVLMRLEVAVIPVSDTDRARDFYAGLGWRLDAEAHPNDQYHLVQMTPPGSNASIIFGKGVTSAEPGSVDRLLLAVDDIDVAREELTAHGVEVSEPFHDAHGSPGGGFHPGTDGRAPGRDPENRSYATYASFSDPDGNHWLLQEIGERLPGRVEAVDVDELAGLLHETAERHGEFEAVAAPHDWWDWYAAYLDTRQRGIAPDDAAATADRYMADVKGVKSPV